MCGISIAPEVSNTLQMGAGVKMIGWFLDVASFSEDNSAIGGMFASSVCAPRPSEKERAVSDSKPRAPDAKVAWRAMIRSTCREVFRTFANTFSGDDSLAVSASPRNLDAQKST